MTRRDKLTLLAAGVLGGWAMVSLIALALILSVNNARGELINPHDCRALREGITYLESQPKRTAIEEGTLRYLRLWYRIYCEITTDSKGDRG